MSVRRIALVYQMVYISVCTVFDLVNYKSVAHCAGAFMDDDLVFLCDLDFGVGGRTAE